MISIKKASWKWHNLKLTLLMNPHSELMKIVWTSVWRKFLAILDLFETRIWYVLISNSNEISWKLKPLQSVANEKFSSALKLAYDRVPNIRPKYTEYSAEPAEYRISKNCQKIAKKWRFSRYFWNFINLTNS